MLQRLLLIGFCWFTTASLFAQKFGIGAQFGEPTGLTLRLNNDRPVCIDILAAWDFDDYFFVNVHGIWQKPLSGSPKVRYFYGPGGYIGFRKKNDNAFFGFSGSLGLSLYIERFEIYAQITPRLTLSPSTDGDMGGGLGFRFYLN